MILSFFIIFKAGLVSATITITSQAQLESTFDSTTTEINETLILEGVSITDLSPLQNVWFIGGQFYINETGLSNLDGLENLNFAQRVFISFNDSLESIHLPGLNDIFFDFDIHDNPSLVSITGGSLPSNNTSLSIDILDNPLLEDISLLEGIQEIWGLRILRCPNIASLEPINELYSANHIELRNFHQINNFNNFPAFTQINSIELQDFPLVAFIDSLSNINLTQFLRRFELAEFPLLASLEPLSTWDFPIKELQLKGLGLVQHFEAFNNNVILEELEIIDNLLLQSVNFDHLEVLNNVFISNCDALSTLNGLTSLDSLSGGLGIQHCDNLVDISDLDQVSYIGGAISLSMLDAPLLLKNLPVIASQDFFPNLKIVNGTVLIDSCGMDSLYGFASLEYIDNDLLVMNNGASLISGFDKLIYCDGFTINDNLNLTHINMPDSLGKDNSNVRLIFNRNGNLNNIQGGKNIKRLGIIIIDSPLLNSFPVLQSLEKWNEVGFLNTGFTHLDFISVSDTMAGIALIDNMQLENINGLYGINFWDSLLYVNTSTLWLKIENNPLLESLEPLTGFRSFWNGTIEITNNASLSNLKGLDSLKECGRISILDNPALESLEGLENLSKIRTKFSIENNPLLLNVDSLNSIDSIGLTFNSDHNLSILNNDLLNDCSVLCALDSFAFIQHGIVLENNNSLCSDMDTVLYYCANPISTYSYEIEEVNFSIYPNPLKHSLFIDFQNYFDGYIEITDINGQLKKGLQVKQSNLEIDLSNFQSGVYIVIIYNQDSSTFASHRIVKIK